MSILTSDLDELCCPNIGSYKIDSEYYLPVTIRGWWISISDVPENQFSCHTHLSDLLRIIDGNNIRIEMLHDGDNIIKCLYHIECIHECETFTWTFGFSPALLPIEINRFIRTRNTSLLNDIPSFISIDLHELDVEYIKHEDAIVARYKI